MNDDTRESSKPERSYFILPPTYRPIALALSTAVVALVVWDRTRAPEELYAPKAGWDGDKVAVKSAAEAPPSIDVSGRLSSADDAGKLDASSTLGKSLNAPGKPVEITEEKAPAAPLTEGQSGTFQAHSEEERSAINERLYKKFEEEKKRMGIARIIDKDAEDRESSYGGREAVRGVAEAQRRTPAVKVLALRSADALDAAWTAAGLPGRPPAVNFHAQMAIFLAGPAGCGIVDVQNRKKLIVVLYKSSGFDDPSARVRAVTLSPKPVVTKLAE